MGEKGHEAEGTSCGRNLQPAPPAGNEVSDCKLENILFVQNRSRYYKRKKAKPQVCGKCIIRKSLGLKKNHSFVMSIIKNNSEKTIQKKNV